MSDESTTPDDQDALRRASRLSNRRDFDALLEAWAPDAVWELSPVAMGVFEPSPPTEAATCDRSFLRERELADSSVAVP
jgi:ketosteroid isomerase-like protein